jgi:hypothetical protein
MSTEKQGFSPISALMLKGKSLRGFALFMDVLLTAETRNGAAETENLQNKKVGLPKIYLLRNSTYSFSEFGKSLKMLSISFSLIPLQWPAETPEGFAD